MSKLEFEKPILELGAKMGELKKGSSDDTVNISEEIGRLQVKTDRLLKQTYTKLTPQQKVQVARHQERPHFLDYVRGFVEDFTPLAGDRHFGEDQAVRYA